MLQNMFVGSPPGNYDRILDFSQAVTGNLFFVPSQSLLDDLDTLSADELAARPGLDRSPSYGDGSLTIGSLRGEAST